MKKVVLFFSFFLLLAAFVAVFFLYLQQLEQEKKKQSALVENTPARGSFFDCSHRLLATTIERVSVYVRLREVVSFTKTAEALAEALDLDAGVIERRLKKGGLHIWIAEDITEEQEVAIGRLSADTGLGVHLQKGKKRYYPYGSYGAYLLGLAEDGIGLSGIEALYDQLVASKKVSVPLAHGLDIVLSLNLKIQQTLEHLLASIREQAKMRGKDIHVAAYLLNSKSGAIVVGAQLPGFDPNDFASYGGERLENMFFAPFFLPDSLRQFLRDCAGLYKTDNGAALAGAWSALPSSSSNAGRQLQLVTSLGLDQLPTVDFYQEKVRDEGSGQSGLIGGRSVSQAGGNRAQMAMIPEVSTPLQLLVALSSLLHGSPEKSPWLVQGFVDPATGELLPLSLATKKKKAGEGAVNVVPDLPKQTVARFVAAAGRKTGHGVLLEGEGGGWFMQPDGGRKYVKNSFVFADIVEVAKESPLALLLVTSEEQVGPRQKVAGRKKATRKKKRGKNRESIGRLLEKELGRISLLHMVSIGTDGLLAQQQEYGNYQGEGRFVLQRKEFSKISQKTTITMPDLSGKSLRGALRSLQGIPVRLVIDGGGVVKEQQPAAGTVLTENSLCRLVLR